MVHDNISHHYVLRIAQMNSYHVDYSTVAVVLITHGRVLASSGPRNSTNRIHNEISYMCGSMVCDKIIKKIMRTTYVDKVYYA